MTEENEDFDWNWISTRRNRLLSAEQTLDIAPDSWKVWVKGSGSVLEKCRRHIVRFKTSNPESQRPSPKSLEQKALEQIIRHYEDRKVGFEPLASCVAARVINQSGGRYTHGWVTPPSSDGGADFIGRVDVGSGFSKAGLVVLGQAKCEKLTVATGGNHIARTVARLRRGWLGIYVTTSYFSASVQRKIQEDKYPILLINGLRLAREVLELKTEGAFDSVESLLCWIDSQAEVESARKDPEEVLYL